MIYAFGSYELDLDSHSVRSAGVAVPVEPQVFDVLAHLVRNRARTVTKEELLDEVWGDRFVSESALTSRIKAARRALGDDGRTQAVIRTVHGRGYQFVAEVRQGTPTGVRSDTPTEQSEHRPRTRYARSDDYSIAYQVFGDADRDLVYVPGFVSNLDLQWELPAMATFFERLAEHHRVIVFDKRGTGLSDRVGPDRLPTIEQRMDDVRAVMDAAGSKRASLFGISEGGPMSLVFAASYPERVERLVLFGTYAHAPLQNPIEMVAATRQWWGSGTGFELLAPSWRGDRATRTFLGRYERASATPETAAMLVGLCQEIDVRPVLPTISVPTLVVHRSGDSVFAVSGARELVEAIPGAASIELPGSDHLVFVDHEPVLDAVLGFLDDDSPSTPRADRALATLLALRAEDDELSDLSPHAVESCLDAQGVPHPRAGSVRTIGTPDGVLALVDGPARAIRCAQDLVASEGPVGGRVRAAVHTAEVELVDGRPTGRGVEMAVAAAAHAGPNEVLVTRTVRDLVVGSGLEFTYRGAETLGGTTERWELYEPSDGGSNAAATTGSR